MIHEQHFPQPTVPEVALRTDTDIAAELQADAAAINGQWEQFAQPGFELSAGTIAVEAAVKHDVSTETAASADAVTTEAHASTSDPLNALEVITDISRPGEVTHGSAFTVKDTRRTTPESVESEFQAKQAAEAQAKREKEEALRQPLTPQEQQQTVSKLEAAVNLAATDAEKPDSKLSNQEKDDRSRDRSAMYRLRQLVNGEIIGLGRDASNKQSGMSISERLDDLVKQYARLTPENYRGDGPEMYIGSMGGTVDIAEDGQVHSEGYNGSILYELARARQTWAEIEANPREMRLAVLQNEGLPDVSGWITEEPVRVRPEDSVMPSRMIKV